MRGTMEHRRRERLITIGIRNDLTDRTEYRFPKPHEYKPVLREVLLDCPDRESCLEVRILFSSIRVNGRRQAYGNYEEQELKLWRPLTAIKPKRKSRWKL